MSLSQEEAFETEPLLYSGRDQRGEHDAISKVMENDPLVSAEEETTDSHQQSSATPQNHLGWSSTYFLVVSRVIGTGVFAMPSLVLQSAGSPGLALLTWLIGALIAWCGLVVSLEYGCMLPRSGGENLYLEFTFKRPPYLMFILVCINAMFFGITAAHAIIFAKYLLLAVEVQATDFSTKAVALTLLVLVSFFSIIFPDHEVQSPWWQHFWTGSNWNAAVLAQSLVKALYAYTGLDNMNNVMGEVKNPVRTLKTVAPAALVTTLSVYILLNVAFFTTIGIDNMKERGEMAAALFFERMFGSAASTRVLSFALAMSAAGTLMVVMFSMARVNAEIARNSIFPIPKKFASYLPYGTPIGGLLLHYIPTAAAIIIPDSATSYSLYAELRGYTTQIFGLAAAVGLLLLRRRRPELPRPYRAWLPAVALRVLLTVVLVAAPLSAMFLVPMGGRGNRYLFAAIAWIALACGILFWFMRIVAVPRLVVFVRKLTTSEPAVTDEERTSAET